MRRFASVARDLALHELAVLKLNVEGAECGILEDILDGERQAGLGIANISHIQVPIIRCMLNTYTFIHICRVNP